MRKKVMPVILVLVLAFTFSVPAYATTYSDLDGHWAEEYMQDLSDRGYLSGYDDGTMRPDINMTACETLVLLSRLYTLSDTESELIQADYAAAAADALSSSLSWAEEYIAVCLAAGIVTEAELDSNDLTAAIQKEDLAVFLVRAMQLTSAASSLSGTTLSFADASFVSSGCRGSVAELYSIGIVKGDDNNYFYPTSSVTRAVVAAMVSRALDYLSDNSITPKIAAYSGRSLEVGILVSATTTSIELKGFDGLVRVYSVPTGAAVTVNGTTKTLSSLYVGCYAIVSLDNGIVYSMAVTSDSSVEWVTGAVDSAYYSATYSYIYVEDPNTGLKTKYVVTDDAEVTDDGKTIAFDDVADDDFVVIKLVNDAVAEIKTVSGDYELTGTIASIKYGTSVSLKITAADGTVYCYELDISALPKITRGAAEISIDRLTAGNIVTVNVENCKVKSIATSGDEDTVSGELTSVSTTKSGTVWVITKDDGTEMTLTLDTSAVAFSGTTSILLSAISVGDDVSVVLYDSVITEIYLESATASSTKVTGEVLAVDTDNSVITILNSSDKLIYINASTYHALINASTGYATYLSSLTVGDLLVVYGSYTDSTNFKAITIIVES